MNVVVLLKQVPDTETKIKVDSNGKSLDTTDIKWIINPYDEYALEAALRLQDSLGASVKILSVGPERVVESIRTAMAMGADEGVLVNDPGTDGSDALGKAKAVWQGNDFKEGEGKDPYFSLCFKETAPFSQPFIDLAQKIYLPLLEHQEEYNP